MLRTTIYVDWNGHHMKLTWIPYEEAPEEAFHREAWEEGSVEGMIQYIGMIEVSAEEDSLYDPNGKYPLIGYQLFYRMDITKCHPFSRENETTTRIWVEPTEVPFVIQEHKLALLVLQEALAIGAPVN